MAEDKNQDQEQTEAKGGGFITTVIVWGLIFIVGAGTGVSVALFVFPSNATVGSEAEEDPNRMDIPDAGGGLAFVEFDEVVANLSDPRYSRYLTCKFQLQVTLDNQEAIQKLVDAKNVLLKNWLIAHLRDKKLSDIDGKLGLNTLRREIHGEFNAMLFTDGIERIDDVLIEDLKIQ